MKNIDLKISKGFTLVELMITIFIVSILTLTALPYFGDNIISAHRTDGRSGLMQSANKLEECKAIYNKYNHANCSSLFPVDSPDKLYDITASLTNRTYFLSATPKSTTSPIDNDCTKITLDQKGIKGGTGGNISVCW